MSSSNRLHAVLVLTASALLAVAPVIQGEQPATGADTMAQILTAWKQRQAAVTSYDFLMTGTEFIAQKDITAQDLMAAGQAIDTKPFTLPDASFDVRIRLVADRSGRTRLECRYQEWSAKERKYVPESAIDIYDGQVRKLFFELGGSVGFPNAHIQQGTAMLQTGDVRVLPLMMVYRPLDGSAGPDFDPARLKLAAGRGVAEGRECLILQSGENTIWVDGERGFLPTRFYEVRRGKPNRSIDVRYAADAEKGWVLAGWTNAAFDGSGKVDDSVTVTVAEQHVNTQIPEDVFDVKYPPGTWVNDYIAKKEYIVRDSGNARTIQAGEFNGKNYEQLLHSEPPGTMSRAWWFFTVLGVNLALLLGIGVWAYLYRRRRKAAR